MKKISPQLALKQAIQMTKMLLNFEARDIYYADFHGENIMVKKDGDLVLTDFGACSRITDRTGKINPKGFFADQIRAKFEEKKQTEAQFKERLFDEHYSSQLLTNFRLILKSIKEADQRDEYTIAFKDLIAFIEKFHQEKDRQDKLNDGAADFIDQIVDKEVSDKVNEEYYQDFKSYYSTMATYERFDLSDESLSKLKISGPSMCQMILDKLRYIVFNSRDLLAMCFDTEKEFKAYYDSKFDLPIEEKKEPSVFAFKFLEG